MAITPVDLSVTNITATSVRLNWVAGESNALQALISSLFGAGEPGAIYIPIPVVLGAQSLFQDAAGTTPVTADGDPDGLMIDQSPNGNNAAQSVSAERPLYNLENGLNSLKGDGVDANIASQDTVSWLTSSTANAFFAVAFKPISTSAGYIVHCDGANSSLADHAFSVAAYNGSNHTMTIGGIGFSIPATSDTVVVYCQFNKTTGAGVISWNGGAEEAIAVGSKSNSIFPLRLFAREGGVYFDGEIYGLVGSEGPVSFENRRNAMSYLAELAGVAL